MASGERHDFGSYLCGGGIALTVPGMLKDDKAIRVLRMSTKPTKATPHAKALFREYFSGGIWKVGCMTKEELEACSIDNLSFFYGLCVYHSEILKHKSSPKTISPTDASPFERLLLKKMLMDTCEGTQGPSTTTTTQNFESPAVRERIRRQEEGMRQSFPSPETDTSRMWH